NHHSKFRLIWSTSDTVENAIGVSDTLPLRGAPGIPELHIILIEDVKQQVHESFDRVIGKSSQVSSLHELPAIELNWRRTEGTLDGILDPSSAASVAPGISLENKFALTEVASQSYFGQIDVDAKLAPIDEVFDQVDRYQANLAGIRDEHLSKIEALPEVIESSVEALDEMQPIAEASLEFEAIKAKWNDPEVMKEQALNQTREVAVNHCEGKEEQL